MEKSNAEKVKDALLYAPVGAFGFVRDNAPTFFSMFVSRGRRDVNKSAQQAEEKIVSTKNHGQIVAMGTPIAKTRAEKLADEAKHKGEEIAASSASLLASAASLVEGTVKTLWSSVLDAREGDTTSTSDKPEKNEDTPTMTPEKDEAESSPQASTHNPAYSYGEDGFIAEPLSPNVQLPSDIKAIYEKLSAPEIIDRLNDYAPRDLTDIRSYESSYRNRQTIIHAINYRLDSSL